MRGHGIRRIALLVVVGLAGGSIPAWAQETAAPPPAEFFGPGAPGANLPGEDAIVLLSADAFTLHPDGRIDHRLHRRIRLQSDFAIDGLGDPRVPYDSLLQEIVVHACRTYTPDGRVVDATPHAFNRTTPDAVAGSPHAMRHQEMVISHVGIERGCVIELDVEVRDRVAHAPWLEGLVFASEEYPVIERLIRVMRPKATPLQRAMVGEGLTEETVAGRFDEAGGGAAEIVTWRGANLAAARETDDGAGGRRTRAHVVFSTCPSWDALAARVREDLDRAARIDPDSGSPLAAWLEGKERDAKTLTRDDRVAAILELTGTLTGSASVAPFEAYRAPRPVERTFETARGDDWDRTVLALALLRRAGVDAEIALRPMSPRPAREVPALAQFDRLLLVVGPDEILDPIGGKRLARAEGWGGQPLFHAGAGETKPRWVESESRESRADVAVSLTLDAKGGAKGEVELDLTGRLHPYEELTDLDAYLEAYAGRLLTGAKVTAKEIAELSPSRARLRFSFAADAVERDANGFLRLALNGGPVEPIGILAGFNLRRPARTTAIVLPGALREDVTWKIALPKGVAPSFLPREQSSENGVGAFRLSTGPNAEDAAALGRGRHGDDPEPIVVRWTLSLPAAEIVPAQYAALRQLYGIYAPETSRLLVVKMAKASKP